MFHNVGKIDQVIRITGALAIFILYFLEVISGDWGEGLLVAAVMLFATSLRRCCPIYALMGLGTCSTSPSYSQKPRIKTKKIKL